MLTNNFFPIICPNDYTMSFFNYNIPLCSVIITFLYPIVNFISSVSDPTLSNSALLLQQNILLSLSLESSSPKNKALNKIYM